MPFSARTTGAEVALVLQDHIRGKNGGRYEHLRKQLDVTFVIVLISGVTQGGLGGETARVLAPYANLLVIVGRSPDKYVYLDRFLLRP